LENPVREKRQEYRERYQINLAEWLLYHQQNIVFDKCYWMGKRAYKNPFDAWVYQEIIYEVQPDVIVEIGSAEGGSTLYLAHLLELIGNGTVVSVDLDRSKFNVSHKRIVQVTGDSSSEEVIAKVSELCQGKKVLIIHDGNHRKVQVLKDLKLYADLVSVGSYLIVEDGIIDLFEVGSALAGYPEGPLAATEEFLMDNQNFIVDESRERYLLTYNPKGFLKRIS